MGGPPFLVHCTSPAYLLAVPPFVQPPAFAMSGAMGASEAEAILSAPLAEVPLRAFLDALSVRHGLQLTEKEVERSAAVLQEQWFNTAEGQPPLH